MWKKSMLAYFSVYFAFDITAMFYLKLTQIIVKLGYKSIIIKCDMNMVEPSASYFWLHVTIDLVHSTPHIFIFISHLVMR